jgi:hypothetical protein
MALSARAPTLVERLRSMQPRARQLAGGLMSSRRTRPRHAGGRDSMSSWLIPTFPMSNCSGCDMCSSLPTAPREDMVVAQRRPLYARQPRLNVTFCGSGHAGKNCLNK